MWRFKAATWRAYGFNDYAALFALLIPVFLIFGRAIADGAVVVMGAAFLLRSAYYRDWSWLRTRWVQISFVMWAYLFVSAFFAIVPDHSGYLRALTWGRWILLTIALVFWLTPQKAWQDWSGWFLIVLVSLIAIDTLVQYVFGTSLSGNLKPDYPGRLSGPFNRLVVGIYLARLFWPAFAHLLSWSQQHVNLFKRMLVPLAFIGLSALVILLSGERMAFLLTTLSLLVFFLFAKTLRKPLLLCGLPLVIAIVAVVATQPALRERAQDAQHKFTHFGESGYGVIFNNAITAWQQSPITGVGPKNFFYLCETRGPELGYQDAKPETPEYNCARHPHNPYLEWLADTGLIGLGLFVLLAFSWSRDAVRTVWQQRFAAPHIYLPTLALAVGLIPFLWPLQGNMSIFTNWNAVLFWWTIGVIVGELQQRRLLIL